MNIRKFYLNCLCLFILCCLLSASVSYAKILGPNTISTKGTVTDIDLQEKWISIDGQTYNLDDNEIILNSLRSQSVQALDKVEFAYQKIGEEKKLISIEKQSDTYK